MKKEMEYNDPTNEEQNQFIGKYLKNDIQQVFDLYYLRLLKFKKLPDRSATLDQLVR